jgi:hypothetical protein
LRDGFTEFDSAKEFTTLVKSQHARSKGGRSLADSRLDAPSALLT